MRIASYNHMFGCNGRSLPEFLHIHALHNAQSYDRILKKSDPGRTADMIRESCADILGIAEVLGRKQRQDMIDILRSFGYQHFHIGKGHGLGRKHSGAIENLIATRMPSNTVYTPDFQVPDGLGHGGGVVGIYVPGHNLYVIQVHLPLCRKKTKVSFLGQLRSILCETERIKKKSPDAGIIIMGDFNCGYEELVRFYDQFSQFRKLSSDAPTCSATNLLKLFYSKNVDYILGMGLEAQGSGVSEGASDHRLVYADIKLI